MIDLNDKAAIAQLDPQNTYSSITGLAKQCQQAWVDTQKLEFPPQYSQIQNMVFCGMGASAYPAYIIKALYGQTLTIPLEIINDYNLPGYVSDNSLVLVSSYSGSTEETLNCAVEALKKGAKITAVTSGGKLASFIRENNLVGYIFNPVHNVSGQPRLGGGYTIVGFMGILNRLGLLQIQDEEINKVTEFLESEALNIEGSAKELVYKLDQKIPIVVSAAHLEGNSHILRNQFNETSKSFASFLNIPELNHHLMEGLVHASSDLIFLLLRSKLYDHKIQKRFDLTKDVVQKNNVLAEEIKINGQTKLEETFYTLSFGGYLTFYLGILYGQDPAKIPWVDYFKEQLEKV